MDMRLSKPKYAIDIVAGLIGIFFDRLVGGEYIDLEPAVEEDESQASSEPAEVKRDNLTVIGGIGPTFARRLNDAGILTFADLAASTPEHVREVAHVAEWQGDPVEWIAQAKSLA